MTKSAFLNNKQVQEFITYLAERWTSGQVFYSGKYQFANIQDGFNKYNWPYKVTNEEVIKKAKKRGETFADCSGVLDELKELIQTACEQKSINKDIKKDTLFLASRAVLKWGEVLGNEQKGNLAYLIKPAKDGGSIYEILDAVGKRWKELNNTASCNDTINFRSNAGFTKIYSLLLDDFVIYDSRVAAALAFFLMKKFGKDIEECLRIKIPHGRLSENDSIFKRNPCFEIFKSTTNKSHFTSNVKASWLLNKVVERINESQPDGSELTLRKFEAALFMIGYDISEGRKPTVAERKLARQNKQYMKSTQDMKPLKIEKMKMPKLSRLQMGYNKYAFIMDNFHECDITSDDKRSIDFKKRFINFYQMYHMKPSKLNEVYSYLEKHKDEKDVSFENTINHFFQKVNSIFTFNAGAIISTINPKYPPFSSTVLAELNLELPKTQDERKVKKAIEFYPQIQKWYKDKLNSASGQKMIRDFDAQIPDSGIKDIKKIDLILWANREK